MNDSEDGLLVQNQRAGVSVYPSTLDLKAWLSELILQREYITASIRPA